MLREDKCTFVRHALFCLKQTTTLQSRYYYLYFTDEEPEAQRYLVTCQSHTTARGRTRVWKGLILRMLFFCPHGSQGALSAQMCAEHRLKASSVGARCCVMRRNELGTAVDYPKLPVTLA